MNTKLTPEVQKRIITMLKSGFYIKQACLAVGICEDTYYEWIKRGKSGEEPFSEFSELTKISEAEGELAIYLEIRKQSSRDWRAGLEILGRKYPDRWGRKDKLNLETDKPLEIKITDVKDKLKAKVKDISKRLAEIEKENNK